MTDRIGEGGIASLISISEDESSSKRVERTGVEIAEVYKQKDNLYFRLAAVDILQWVSPAVPKLGAARLCQGRRE